MERMYGMEDGGQYANQQDDEEDDQREAFVREHGGLLL